MIPTPCCICTRPADAKCGVWSDDCFYFVLCAACGVGEGPTALEIDAACHDAILFGRTASTAGPLGAPISTYSLKQFRPEAVAMADKIAAANAAALTTRVEEMKREEEAKAPPDKKKSPWRPKVTRINGRLAASPGACRACVFIWRVTGARAPDCWRCGTPDGLVRRPWKQRQLRALRRQLQARASIDELNLIG